MPNISSGCSADGGFEVELNSVRSDGAAGEASELRMYALGDAPILSELMPMLQNFGIRVLSEDAHQLSPLLDGKPARDDDRIISGPRSRRASRCEKMPGVSMLAEAIVGGARGNAENDPLNVLMLTAGLRWREVALVRAYLSAAFQMRLAPAPSSTSPRVSGASGTRAHPRRPVFARLDPNLPNLPNLQVPAQKDGELESAGSPTTAEELRADISNGSARWTTSPTIAPRARFSRWSRRRCAPTIFFRRRSRILTSR